MRDASKVPRAWKRYTVGNQELKAALGIDWPGKILSVRGDYGNQEFEVTMSVQPHELTGTDRERYTRDEAVPVPKAEPGPAPAKAEPGPAPAKAEPGPAPAKAQRKRRRWL